MHARYPTICAAAVVIVLSGCAGSSPSGSTVASTPQSRRSEQRAGTITVRGDYAPGERGPYALHGRYRVRFTQRGAGVDFGNEVPFTAHLEEAVGAGPRRAIPLFQRAAASGTTSIRVDGRFTLLIDYGDSPYEIVLTRSPAPAS